MFHPIVVSLSSSFLFLRRIPRSLCLTLSPPYVSLLTHGVPADTTDPERTTKRKQLSAIVVLVLLIICGQLAAPACLLSLLRHHKSTNQRPTFVGR